MSITDELRAWAKGSTLSSWTAEHLTAIADCIDAEHESACAEAYGNGVMSVPIALDESAWIELPKDADGVPIRFKDKVTVPWSDKVYEVSGFSYQENVHTGTMTIWINTHVDGEYRALCATDSCHHHAPDTWERIIEDARTCTGSAGNYTSVPSMRWTNEVDALVARCKALCERTKEDA